MTTIETIQAEIKRQKNLLDIANAYQNVLTAWKNRNDAKYKFQTVSGNICWLFESAENELFSYLKLQFQPSCIQHFLEMYEISYDKQHPLASTELKRLLKNVKFLSSQLKGIETEVDAWDIITKVGNDNKF